MALDPRIILSIPAAMDQNRARNIQQQQADTNSIEAQLRAAELQQRMQELRDAAMRKNQPAAYDPKKAGEELDYQLKLGNAVVGQLQAAQKNPAVWSVARQNIARLAGPQAIADLPEQWDDNTAQIVGTHIASWPQHEAEVKGQLINTVNAAGEPVQKYITPKPGDEFPVAPPKPAAEGRPVQVETTNDKGQRVTRFVMPTEGLEFPKPAPASAAGGGAPNAATGGLDPDGLELAGAKYRITGQTLSRDHTQNAAIANEAAKQGKLLGNSPVQTIQRQAAYAGDANALKKMQAMSASAESFENKANAQTSIIRDLSTKVPRTSWPIINSALQAGRTEITGDPNATMLANAVETFTEEYAKVMSGATGSSAAASDSARAASKRLINTAMSNGTMDKVLSLMQREMDLTMQGYQGTIGHITERMGGSGASAGAPAAAAPAASGARDRVVGPNGESGTVPAGTALPPGWSKR